MPSHDVVHVAREAREHDQRDVNDDEPDEADEHQEVEGTGRLPTPEELGVGGETVHQRGRHRHAGEDGERRHDENRGEVGQLLKGVVPVEAVRFRREAEVGVVDEGVPRLHEHGGRGGHQPPPLVAGEESPHEEDAG